MIAAYYKRLTSEDAQTRLEAARRWSTWENATSKLYLDEEHVKKGDDDKVSWADTCLDEYAYGSLFFSFISLFPTSSGPSNSPASNRTSSTTAAGCATASSWKRRASPRLPTSPRWLCREGTTLSVRPRRPGTCERYGCRRREGRTRSR